MRWLLAALALGPGGAFAPSAPLPERRTVELTTVVRVVAPPTPGRLALWIPYPVDDAYQRVLRFTAVGPVRGQVRQERRDGNRMYYLTLATARTPFPFHVTLRWRIERRAITGPLPANGSVARFRVPFVAPALLAPIGAIARREAAPDLPPGRKWTALYDYVYRTMTYSKDGEGWGRGDPVWACTNQRGNCTDFHSLLIALGQSQGLAGRFDMGLPLPPAGLRHAEAAPASAKPPAEPGSAAQAGAAGPIAGYHCWATLYDDAGQGIAVDASEAKKAGDKAAYFGRLPPDRIHVSSGRQLILDPPQGGPPLNFLIYPYAELDGEPYDALSVEWLYQEK